MSGDRSNSVSSTSSHQRRPSLTAGSFSEMFRSSGGAVSPTSAYPPAASPPFPSPIATAAASAQSNQRRRLSITTLGLSGTSPTQPSFTTRAARDGSLSSSVGSDDTGEEPPPSASLPTPSPLARRMSFGAQALRDVRGNTGIYPSSPISSSSSSFPFASIRSANTNYSASASAAPSASSDNITLPKKRNPSNPAWRPLGEGFNWTEALRTRAERRPSLAGGPGASTTSTSPPNKVNAQAHHQRAASIAIMEQPTREIPKQPRQQEKPDFFQEKILRADFMD